ncbi:hypothetical protein [Pleurocapsa sp. PCC 7319]|uniref:hypothetical protein n=1 Tax=Pleurocapsa sp. PCC 7319 TaxID=118161 RepID=UPI00034C9835|nr:hypothetical protein [Pleurocapsa sp. PCC 7319]
MLWIYLLPIVGVIPAIWTLYLSQKDRETRKTDSEKRHLTQLSNQANYERQKVSRWSVTLILVWLSSYCLLSLGAANTSGIIAFRLLYTNAILTTGYFVTCTVLMFNLHKRNLFPADKD